MSLPIDFDDEFEKTFTPQEANKMLPELRQVLRRLIEKKRFADKLKDEIEKYRLIGISNESIKEKAKKLDAIADEILFLMEEISSMGVVLRDIDIGLVDFPAERYGERVYLCWRYGEKEVLYWHKAEEGYSGRKPIKTQVISR